MRPLCEEHKVEPTHKLGPGDFQTLRTSDAANGVELHRSVVVGSYLHNKVLLGAVIWIHCQGRLGRMEELLFLIGLLRAETTSRHLSPTVIAREHAAIDSAIEFFDRRHIFDTNVITPNLMNIA